MARNSRRKLARVWEKSANPCGERGAGAPVILMMATDAKQRMAEMRARERRGIEIIQNIPVSDRFRLIDRLIEWSLIAEDASSDDRAVAQAVGRLLDKIAVTRNSPFG
ncbi:hypothetical protein ABIA94_006284 [Bradyrhizobium sp. LA7.1]